VAKYPFNAGAAEATSNQVAVNRVRWAALGKFAGIVARTASSTLASRDAPK